MHRSLDAFLFSFFFSPLSAFLSSLFFTRDPLTLFLNLMG
jgi:hypothetical protein